MTSVAAGGCTHSGWWVAVRKGERVFFSWRYLGAVFLQVHASFPGGGLLGWYGVLRVSPSLERPRFVSRHYCRRCLIFCPCLCRLCSSALLLYAVYAVCSTWRYHLLRGWMDFIVVLTPVVACVNGCAFSRRDAQAPSGLPCRHFSDALLVWAAVATTLGGGRRGIKSKHVCGNAWSTVLRTAAVTHD